MRSELFGRWTLIFWFLNVFFCFYLTYTPAHSWNCMFHTVSSQTYKHLAKNSKPLLWKLHKVSSVAHSAMMTHMHTHTQTHKVKKIPATLSRLVKPWRKHPKTFLISFSLCRHGIHTAPYWLQYLFAFDLMKGSFWCDPWTAWPVRPTYAFLWRNRPDRETAAALLTRPASHTHHAPCCRDSWTTRTKVILHMRVHMCASLYLMQTLIYTQEPGQNCRSDGYTRDYYKCSF